MTTHTEIARVAVPEGRFLVNYIMTLEYTPATTETDDDGTVDVLDPEWSLCVHRVCEGDAVNFIDPEDRVSAWLDDPEDRAPTVHDVDPDAWQAIFDSARNAYGWDSWHDCVTAIRLFSRLLQESDAP
jgi:hypothetical protein